MKFGGERPTLGNTALTLTAGPPHIPMEEMKHTALNNMGWSLQCLSWFHVNEPHALLRRPPGVPEIHRLLCLFMAPISGILFCLFKKLVELDLELPLKKEALFAENL